MKTEEYLMNIAKQEKQFDALYRNAGAIFHLPDCTMWVLYYLYISKDKLSQQDLVEKMMFPKQTINSAIKGLKNKKLVELCAAPGMRNKKSIMLTESGEELARQTVGRMFRAECRAVEQLGPERIRSYMELYQEFYTNLHQEFQKDMLTDGT